MRKDVLIINTNLEISEKIKENLSSLNTNVICVTSVLEAIPMFGKREICLIILDAKISKQENHQLLVAIRKLRVTPILILSAQFCQTERLEVLQAGAHAYMGEPYSMEECLAQAQSLMQLYCDIKPQQKTCYTLVFGKNLIIDPLSRQVILDGKELKLTRKEFDLLFCLASSPGQVFSREQLYEHVWDEDSVYNVDDVVKAHIKSLRRKLSDADVTYIKNVWGIGYRFHDETDDV